MFFRLFNTLLAKHTPAQFEVDGPRLQSVGRQIWVADRDLAMVGGLRFPVRMVVIGNASGDLLCYSPVALDDATIEALSGIGEVRWIVAPNPHHTLFARDYQQQFPDARLLAVAPISGCTVQIFRPPAQSEGRIDHAFEALAVSLRGEFKELVIYHDLSETLIVSDLLFNIHSAGRPLELLMRLNGAWQRAGHTRMQRLMILRDRQGLADFYRWALARPFVQITMSHGEVIKADAREAFYQVFSPYAGG